MGRTCLRRLASALALAASLTATGFAQTTTARIRLVGADRLAAQISFDGAVRKLADGKCRAVFADFSLVVPEPVDTLPVWFLDGGDAPACRALPTTLAFTSPGSRVVHLCAKQFAKAFFKNRGLAEATIIHELLHVYGLDNDQPSSEAITGRVFERCGG